MFVERLDHHEYISPIQSHHPSTLMIQDWKQTNQNDAEVIAGFTTKNGGVSQKPFESLNTGLHVHDKDADVVKNREYIADMFNIDLQSWVFADQTHDNRVQKVTQRDREKALVSITQLLKQQTGSIQMIKMYFWHYALLIVCPYSFSIR